jgi:hypothetical protein
MQHQGSHEQRVAALGRYFNSGCPALDGSPRRLDTTEFMRPGHNPERAILWRAVVDVNSHGQ